MNLKDVIENTKNIYMTDSTMNTLVDFERVLDSVDMYAYANWIKGELIEGPISEKYFITCKFMWPYKLMPDPRGGKRLLMYGCKVYYEEDKLAYPVKIKTPDDYRPGSRKAEIVTTPIWIVTIVMPKKLMSDIYQGAVEIEGEEIDLDDINSAYEENLDQGDVQSSADEDFEEPSGGQGDEDQEDELEL